MGCGQSDADWQTEMENLEMDLLMLSGVKEDAITRKYTMIKMIGPQAIRTVIIDEGGEDRKTLVMLHGYPGAGCHFFKILKPLAKRYRLVLVDYLGFGCNSRVNDIGDALESSEKSEKYIEEYLVKVFDKLTEQGDIPEKFSIAGASFGGHFSMVYGGLHPERIEKMVLLSPLCGDYEHDKNFDEYNVRYTDAKNEIMSKSDIDGIKSIQESKDHMYSAVSKMPVWMIKMAMKGTVKEMFDDELYTS